MWLPIVKGVFQVSSEDPEIVPYYQFPCQSNQQVVLKEYHSNKISEEIKFQTCIAF